MTELVSEHLVQEAASDINLLLRDFQKLIKVISLYPPDNPLPSKMRDSVGERFLEVVRRFGGLKFEIRPKDILYNGEIVFQDKRREEALADMFYRAGIVSLDIKKDLSAEEFRLFLNALKEYLNQPATERDLVTLLWQEQFSHIRFTTIEDAALREYDSEMVIRELRSQHVQAYEDSQRVEFEEIILELEDEKDGGKISDQTSADMAEAARQTGISLDSPSENDERFRVLVNESFSLTFEEQRQITHLLQENRHYEPYRTITRILVEILQIWNEIRPFSESVSICEKILDQLLAAGAFAEAADFVHSVRGLREQITSDRAAFGSRLDDFLRRAGDKDHIEHLTDLVNRQEKVNTGSLEIYFESLGWESLAYIAEMLGRLVSKNARLMVCDYLARHGRSRLAVIGNGVRDNRWYVVRNSVMILGRIGGEQILNYLKGTIRHADSRVRAETMRVLAELGTDDAVEMLCMFLEDPDSGLRLECLKNLERVGGRTAFENIWNIINSDQFEKYALEEQQWFLIGFSRLGGSEVVDFLAAIVGTIRLFAPGHSMRYRLAALTALVHNRSEEAEQVILKFSCSRRKWLREAASAALEQRRKLIYGGSTEDGQC